MNGGLVVHWLSISRTHNSASMHGLGGNITSQYKVTTGKLGLPSCKDPGGVDISPIIVNYRPPPHNFYSDYHAGKENIIILILPLKDGASCTYRSNYFTGTYPAAYETDIIYTYHLKLYI